MPTIQMPNFEVCGVRVRTCNADEENPVQARLVRLWQSFAEQVMPLAAAGARVYGVYHHYESDASGAYDVLAGVDKLNDPAACEALQQVCVAGGPYLVFEAQGPVPQAVLDAWAQVWRYFDEPMCPHQRAYTTDFECYDETQSIRVFIAVVPI